MDILTTIESTFREILSENGLTAPVPLPGDLVLLNSGLDSLGFAILVTKLEGSLGYDPFVIMKSPVYPRTYQEFVDIYLNNKPS